MIKGITVALISKKQTGKDPFDAPIYEEVAEPVENVLIGEPSAEAVISELELYGKRIAYTLAIPKGDTHHWEDQEVEFFGERFKVYGHATQGIENMIPLGWNKKVKVERYE